MKKQTWIDKKIKEIEEWGPLTLFTFLKDTFNARMQTERDILFKYGALKHEGSNLHTHDRHVAAVNKAFDREFKKIYNQLEKEYAERAKI